MDRSKITLVAPFVVLAAVLYFFRPWIHTVVMSFYVNPYLLESVLAGILVGAFMYRRISDEEKGLAEYGSAFNVAALAVLVFFLGGAVLNTAFSNVAMSHDLQDGLKEIDSLPDIDNQNPRILPRTVAREFAENSLQEPRHRLASSDIAIDDSGTPQWSFPLQPDGDVNRFIIKQKGAAFVDMTTSSSNISYSGREMDVGIGMQVTDNIDWALRKKRFWVNYEDSFVLQHEGETYIATPYIKYEYRFRFPIVYTVPKWGGVALTDSSGKTEYIDAENVKKHEILGDQRAYPFDLARKYVSSMEYREGIINRWIFHRNQLEVAPVPGFNNDQPFMILTDENPELFVATEPYGEASGLFEIWTIDAVTGDYEVYRLNRSQGLIGANRAVNFVRQANSKVNWAGRDSSTGFAPIEPLPVIVDDRLYWQVRVVPLDSAGIAFTSFVDAKTSNVYTARSDKEIVNFLKGKDVNQTAPDSNRTAGNGVKIQIFEDGELVENYTTGSRNFDIRIRD